MGIELTVAGRLLRADVLDDPTVCHHGAGARARRIPGRVVRPA